MSPSPREGFERSLAFGLDDFQVRALDALDAGSSVVVAAPTGSGKTIVAEYAIHRALAEGRKAFYTAPIKALSNQKFNDLVNRYGAERVGLLTGDNSINPTAPIVVMTTEVLRNMIYARSPTLQNLRYVVLDEVHYLQDAYRGPVWEEVIIHTPLDVDMVCLSATVSNAEELADWVTSVRGRTIAIIHETRPIELNHLYLVGNRDTNDVTILPTFVDGRPNPVAARLDAEPTGYEGPRTNRRRPTCTPKRLEVVAALRHADMLPAIYFIFSRSGCDEATRSCLQSGARLTLPVERREITAIVEARVAGLSDSDLEILDYQRFLAALQNGYAAHHAGMVPPFKEAVEACFVEGLVKVVFATETLALGINMPARTVVVEKLTKFGGERHQFLTPGEYTQLTGRAGRRGIDNVGFAAALWTPFIEFEQVSSLAALRTYELKSSFRPTNNMAVNLVRRYGPDEAHHLLAMSFAQYRVDASLSQTSIRIERLRREVAEALSDARCEHGDIGAYLNRQQPPTRGPAAPEREVMLALDGLRPGDVLTGLGVARAPVDGPRGRDGATDDRNGEAVDDRPGVGEFEGEPRYAPNLNGARPGDGWSVVVSTARRRDRPTTVKAITVNGRLLSLTARDFRAVPTVVAQVRLPASFNPNSRSFQQQAANSLAKVIDRSGGPKKGSRLRPIASTSRTNDRARPVDPLRSCPDFSRHVGAHERALRVSKDIDRLIGATRDRQNSLADQFDAVLRLLEELAYLDGWSVTPMGDMLAGIFHESDLLIAECLQDGVLDGVSPADLAGLVSCFVFEERGSGSRGSRGRAPGFSRQRNDRLSHGQRGDRSENARTGDLPRDFPKPLVGRFRTMCAIVDDVMGLEADMGLPISREVAPGFVGIARQWASGRELETVLNDSDITGGDFVRTVRILIDLLRQIGNVAPDPATAKAARQAAENLFRGVVSAASITESTGPATGVGVRTGKPAAHPATAEAGEPVG